MPTRSPPASMRGEKYVSLATFRRTGEAVPTPVWFAESDGRLYLRTLAGSGKVKRIRHDPRVRLAPCDAEGAVRGGWLEGTARVLPSGDPAIEVADRVLDEKYGEERRHMTRLMAEQGKRLVFIEIAPSAKPPDRDAARRSRE